MKKASVLFLVLVLSLSVTTSSLAASLQVGSLVRIDKIEFIYDDGSSNFADPFSFSGQQSLTFYSVPGKKLTSVDVTFVGKGHGYIDCPQKLNWSVEFFDNEYSGFIVSIYTGETIRFLTEDKSIVVLTITASSGVDPNPHLIDPSQQTTDPQQIGQRFITDTTQGDLTIEQKRIVGEPARIGRCQEWVNVRSDAGTGYGIIGKVYLGEEIELLQWNKDETWCKVLYNNGSNAGWVFGKYIISRK